MSELFSTEPPANKVKLPIRVQSVLYNTPRTTIGRTLEYFENAAAVGRAAGLVGTVGVALGDSSSERCIEPRALDHLRHQYPGLDAIDYVYFGSNLGHGGGQNRLMENVNNGALLLIANPDVLADPQLFVELIAALSQPDVGIAEARQIPIEHPKEFDSKTGETGWASMACAMVSTRLFRQVGGFDADTFFMYCDDVDFSWRVRLAGFKIIHTHSAIVFHDKRLTREGGWIASNSERYYSAEAALLLPYKYSRSDLTNQHLETFRASNNQYLIKAAEAFELRVKTGRLPTPIDSEHSVAQFIDGGYGPNRYAPR